MSYYFVLFSVLFFLTAVILIAYWLKQFVKATKENIKTLLQLNKEIANTGNNLSLLVMDNRKEHETMKQDINQLKDTTKRHGEQLEQLTA